MGGFSEVWFFGGAGRLFMTVIGGKLTPRAQLLVFVTVQNEKITPLALLLVFVTEKGIKRGRWAQ
jgi:hypothetical protein